jgi:hypothetical protein
METLRTLLASLGSPGATRNAETAVQAHRAEERTISTLVERLALLEPPRRLAMAGAAAPAA